jgi:hypothetical protein
MSPPTNRRGGRCLFHCCSCGAHFSSLEGFDAHRDGSHREDTRHCVDPATIPGLHAETGSCDIGRSGRPVGAFVYAGRAARSTPRPAEAV